MRIPVVTKRLRLAGRLIGIAVVAAMMTSALALTAGAAVGTWLAPTPGRKITARNVEVSVGYNTQSDLRVTRLELWIDGRYNAARSLVRPESRGVCSFWWDTARFSRGSHELAVKIFAGDELVATVSGAGSIGTAAYNLRAPNVRFANVKSGDVLKGVTSVKMAVSDDGAEPPIVSLLVDNALKFLTNRRPYVYGLDTTRYADGGHELQTFAYDSSGNRSDPAVVKVLFRNNLEKPVVAAMNVESGPAPVAPSEDDGVGKLLPPLTESPVGPDAGTTGAARASEPEADANKPAAIAHPVAPKNEPARVQPAAKPAARPAKSVPAPMPVTAPAPRTVVTPPAVARSMPVRPAEPKIVAVRPVARPTTAASIAEPVPAEP